MTSFRVQLPEEFDFRRQEEWLKWSRRFERFRQSSGLVKEKEESQINKLIFPLGDQEDDILTSIKLTMTQKQYHTVKTKLDEHFVVRRNVTFKRAKFSRSRQEDRETVDTFIRALHALAEYCNYGTLKDGMIRDRIVVGLQDQKLSEKIQLIKIDTRADVPVIPEKIYEALRPTPTLVKSSKTLFGPAHTSLPVRGCFVGKIQKGDKTTEQEMFLVNGARNALLGRPAIEALAIVKKVDAVEASDLKEKFPGLFTGL